MLDDRGVDYGAITGIGLALASAVVLLVILFLLRSSAAADRGIALEAAASEVCGDVEMVAAMAIPYRAERFYEMDGIDVRLSSGYVKASCGKDTFSRPFAAHMVPGTYEENGTMLWSGPAGMREYFNVTFNATGTVEMPIDINKTGSLRELLRRAGMSTLARPVEVPHGRPLIIEKTFIYFSNGTAQEVEPCVLTYAG